jgi:hypothetical protein
MTRIGDDVLNELVTELNEKIEDDKVRLRWAQALSIAGSTWRIFNLQLSFLFNGVLVASVLLLFLLDSQMLDALRAASNDEILSGIRSLLNFVVVTSFFALAIAVTLASKSYFRDVRKERLGNDQAHSDQVTLIVRITEELLLRHQLVEVGERGNG